MIYEQLKLTVFILIVAFYDRFSSLPGDEKPFTCVGQVLVLDGQVLGQYALALGQPVRVWAEKLVVFVLVLIVTISRREYVIVELHHGNHAGVQQIFRVHDFGTSVLPKPCQHVGSVNGHVGFHTKPFLNIMQSLLIIFLRYSEVVGAHSNRFYFIL